MMSMRDIYSMGLIAGLGYREMRHMLPGFIMDMGMMRMEYDSKMNWGKSILKQMGKGNG